ncbi:DEAD/DEAH box helicase [Virgibacillus soli]|uniref:DEAD/DEAH box helicase n=1 Tax=Paracerasibacillus soli TaxID=480284 RepID=UPI0035E9F0D3
MQSNNFTSFSFRQELHTVLEKLHFHQPTGIQEKIIPAILSGESVIGQSQTGSGKTHAFLLPIFNLLDESKQGVQFVITSPTRELATQIYNEVKKMIQYANKEGKWTTRLLVGGTDKQRMIDKLTDPPHIIVGTPGRILDLVQEGVISIFSARSFVIDEADLMLDLGLIKEIDQLLVRCNQAIQVLVFSATIPQKMQPFLKKYLSGPIHVKMDQVLSPETMEHRLIHRKHREEADVIMEISQAINPYIAIIFTNGREQADKLSNALLQRGLEVGILHGGLPARERKRALKEIQNLRYQYIVATDLAARGIHIEGVSHVINAQLPKQVEFYIHRVGRTARAGMEGTAISLYTEEDLVLIEKLEEQGLKFTFSNIKNGSWVEDKHWNRRNIRKKTDKSLEEEAWRRVPKAKKVKPGYRKKMKQQQQQIKRQLSNQTKRNYKK